MRGACLKYGIVFVLLALSAGGLMRVSQHVQKVDREIAAYDRDIERQQEKIRVMRAEWAYLNNPARLEALASGSFDLQATNVKAVITNPDLIPEYADENDSGVTSSAIPVSFGYGERNAE